ncbi:DUF2062 domain-containing protein [Desulfobacca acetoxidans]|nr:DUF2062 domain-containing protein [Desulfobacterales bacterium]
MKSMRLRRKIRYCYWRLRRLKGDPGKIAWGMALGVFIGVTPTIPFHMISALALASILRVSRTAAVMGCWVSNPITIPALYYFSFKLGKLLLYPHQHLTFPHTINLSELLQLGWRVNLALQTGGLLLALPSGMVAYFLMLWAVRRLRAQKPAPLKSAIHLPQSTLPPSQADA